MCARTEMREPRDTRLSVADEGTRAPNLAQRPQHTREVKHRRHAHVLAKAEGQIVITPGLENGQRMFKMISRLAVLSSEPMRSSDNAASDSSLGRIRVAPRCR